MKNILNKIDKLVKDRELWGLTPEADDLRKIQDRGNSLMQRKQELFENELDELSELYNKKNKLNKICGSCYEKTKNFRSYSWDCDEHEVEDCSLCVLCYPCFLQLEIEHGMEIWMSYKEIDKLSQLLKEGCDAATKIYEGIKRS